MERTVTDIVEICGDPNAFDERVVIRWERHPLERAAVPRILANEGVQPTTLIAHQKNGRGSELGRSGTSHVRKGAGPKAGSLTLRQAIGAPPHHDRDGPRSAGHVGDFGDRVARERRCLRRPLRQKCHDCNRAQERSAEHDQ